MIDHIIWTAAALCVIALIGIVVLGNRCGICGKRLTKGQCADRDCASNWGHGQ